MLQWEVIWNSELLFCKLLKMKSESVLEKYKKNWNTANYWDGNELYKSNGESEKTNLTQ